MFEKRWAAVPPQPFTVDGGTDGTIKVAADACTFFKVKQQVYLTATSLQNLNNIEIKKILDDNTIVVGPVGGNIHAVSDVSAYTVALGAAIVANEQKRSSVPFEEFTRAVYEEEPTVANRSILVDQCGNKFNKDNPFPVSIGDATIDADLEVAVDGIYNAANNPDPDNVGVIGHTRKVTPGDVDQINRITSVTNDDVHALDVSVHNSDGSAIDENNPLSVSVVGFSGANNSYYNEVSSVAAASLTTILTYTVPALTLSKIFTVDVAGTNVAAYQVEVNTVIIDKKYTYFSGPLNEVFNFDGSVALVAGDVVRVRVIHGRPGVGDFNARIAVSEET